MVRVIERFGFDYGDASSFYKYWREWYINDRIQRQAEQTLQLFDLTPDDDIYPSEVTAHAALVHNGYLEYDTLAALLADVEDYFVPQMPEFIKARVPAPDAFQYVSTADVVPPSEKTIGGGRAPFERLAEALGTWVATKETRYIDDSFIDIFTHVEKYYGRLRLRLERDSMAFTNPTRDLEDFAAFVDKTVTYDGAVALNYMLRNKDSFAEVLCRLQQLISFEDDMAEALWQDFRHVTEGRMSTQGYNDEYQYGHQNFVFPRVGIYLKHIDPVRQNAICHLFRAISTAKYQIV